MLASAACAAAAACSTAPAQPDNAGALRQIALHHAGAEIVVRATVLRVFPNASGPFGVHERFVVRVSSGPRSVPLFVADNITLGSAAPLQPGEQVVIKGELAFDALGPVLHWTHRDPRFRHSPGFVEVGGRVYE